MWSRYVYTRALQITPGMLNTYYCRLIKNNIIFSSVLPQSFVPLPLHSFPWQIEPGLSPYLSIMLSLHHNMSVSLGALTLNQSITLPLSFSSLNPSFRESCWHFLQTGLTSLALFLSSPLSLSLYTTIFTWKSANKYQIWENALSDLHLHIHRCLQTHQLK